MVKVVLFIVVVAATLALATGYANRAFMPSSLARLQSTAGDEQVYQLFVGNLPFNVDDKQLSELVSQRIGSTYKSLRIAQDKKTGRSRGFGYIDFADNAEAEGSMNLLKGIVVDGREIKIDVAGVRSVNYDRSNSYNKDKDNKFKPRTPQENSVFIGNLDLSIAENDVMTLCNSILGEGTTTRIRVAIDRDTNKPKGYGHIEFASASDAQRAINELNGKKLGNKEILVAPAQRKEDRVKDNKSDYKSRRNESMKHSVFLGNLPWEVTNELVEEMVNDILGPNLYSAVRLATDKETGRTRGFGHVDFKDQESANRAVEELNGLEVMGRQLRADHAAPRIDNKDRGTGAYRKFDKVSNDDAGIDKW